MLSGRVRAALALVVGGTVGAQIIIVITSPILTRIYSPKDFGAFSAFSAVVAVTGTVAALRFESSIPIPPADDEAYTLVWLGLLVATITGSVGMLVMCAAVWLKWWDGAISGSALLLIPITSTLFGFAAVLSQLAIRQQRYHRYAIRKLTQSVAVVASQVGLGYVLVGPIGLILGYSIGQLCVFISLSRGSGLPGPQVLKLSPQKIRSAAHEYRRFPIALAPSGLLNTLGLQAPVLLVASLYGAQVAGWFGLTQKVLAAPVALIGTSVAQVYLGELASQSREGDPRLRRLFSRVSMALGALALIFALVIGLTGPEVFELAFGPSWHNSGIYAQALSIGIAGQLFAAPISQTLIVLRRTSWQLIWDTLRLLGTGAAVVIPSLLGWTPAHMIVALGIVLCASYLLLWAMCWQAVRSSTSTPSRV